MIKITVEPDWKRDAPSKSFDFYVSDDGRYVSDEDDWHIKIDDGPTGGDLWYLLGRAAERLAGTEL